MNSRYLAGVAAAVLIAGVLVTATFASAFPSWAVATAATATEQNDSVTKLTVTGSDDIERKVDLAGDAVAGFGWADLVTLDVLVATIHPDFRDSAQNPDSWHLHAARLGGVDADSFCVQEFYPNPQGGISIQGDTLSVNLVNSDMPFETSEIDGAVGFVINPVAASALCPAVFSGFGLQVDITGAPVGLS